MASVLIELPGGEGIVRQEDGEIALTHDVSLESGSATSAVGQIPTGPRVAQPGADAVRWIAPSGAVSVEAVEATGVRKTAAVGGGTYAVILEDGEHGEPALGYRHAAGSFIHRPMPAEYAHQPVPDAEQPCPVCGAIQYDEYFPTEEWRAGRGRKGTDTYRAQPARCLPRLRTSRAGGCDHALWAARQL